MRLVQDQVKSKIKKGIQKNAKTVVDSDRSIVKAVIKAGLLALIMMAMEQQKTDALAVEVEVILLAQTVKLYLSYNIR